METSKYDNLIRGMCFIKGVSFISIINTGVTHLFISFDCVNKLNLGVSSMVGSMVINTPTNGSVTTTLVCLNFPVKIYGKYSGVDLICLPLSQLDVIMGMNNFMLTMLFPEPEERAYSRFISVGHIEVSLRENNQVFMMFASLRVEGKAMIVALTIVCKFPDMFPDYISNLPLER